MRDFYRGLGFQFALDDTGAGYAGLEELLEVEPDYIKIDRAMVSGVDQIRRQGVLSAVLQLADKMGAQVIGEARDSRRARDAQSPGHSLRSGLALRAPDASSRERVGTRAHSE